MNVWRIPGPLPARCPDTARALELLDLGRVRVDVYSGPLPCPGCGHVFVRVVACSARGVPVDLGASCPECRRRPTLADFGGRS